ncbi:MAG: Abi family protein [Victivallales bacterium]|nr:Abi family protein [Victivallales bacterium]
MKYGKPPLSCEDQASLIISRGMIVDDRDRLISILRSVNYYRLSAYWYPFRIDDDSFKKGTNFFEIWRRYTFDRQLRLLVMDAIERIEISVKAKTVNAFSLKYGAFGHLDRKNFNKFPADAHQRFVEEIKANTKRSNESFVSHFKIKYHEESHLPLWMATELMTFGNMFTMFRYLDFYLQRDIAKEFGVPAKVFESWLQTINYVRNICAHHARLWNREFAIKPVIPNKQRDWLYPVKIENNRLFGLLTVLKYLLEYCAPYSLWYGRLQELLKKYEDVSQVFMGFPDNWQKCPIWTRSELK